MRPTPEQLAEVPLFESLSPEQLEAVASLTDIRREEAGTTLVGEGSRGYSLFVLQEGTATVRSGGETVATLKAGDYFGEIALLGEGHRTASVTAESPVTLLVMLGSDFHVFERDFPAASALMRQSMAERLER